MDFEAAVIGAGPGGLVSALYLRRFLRSTILVGDGPPRASWIPKSYNVIGYRSGISGIELLRRLQKQLDDVGIERAVGRFRVDPIRGGFRLSSGEQRFTAKKVVIATGMSDVQPDLKNLSQLRRLGLLRYCPICDGFEYRNKKIFVLARNDHGLRTARFLSQFTKNLDVLWLGEGGPSKWLLKMCLEQGIRVHEGTLLEARPQRAPKKGLTLDFALDDGRKRSFEADACYVELGIVINDFAFAHLKELRRNEQGYLIAGPHQELDIPGLFAVGDCVEGLAQIAVATGQAALAATRIHNQLRDEADRPRRISRMRDVSV